MSLDMSPMLASKYDANKQQFPALCSMKLDGFRCIASNGLPLTRKLLVHQNKHVQNLFKAHANELEGMDGELIVGSPHNVSYEVEVDGHKVTETDDVFDRTSGPIRRFDGNPDFSFYVFDLVDKTLPFHERYAILEERVKKCPEWVKIVKQTVIHSKEEVESAYQAAIDEGYEGLMLRSKDGLYKFGRATTREGYLSKVKKRVENEARIIGFVEEKKNNNKAVKDATGHTKRSSHSANKTGKGTLGAFVAEVVNGPQKGIVFTCGSGLTAAQRKKFWEERDSMMGEYFTFEHLEVGAKVAPRHPVFKRLRPEWDIGVD